MINNTEQKKPGVHTRDLVLTLLVTTFGALFFLCVTRSINGDSLINPWISAMICAAVFEMLLVLFAVTVGIKKMIVPVVIIAFLPSIIFVPIVWHMIVVVIAILIAINGMYVMRHTLFNGLKIDIKTIVRSGVAYISFAIIIVVTSQYYFFIKDNTETVFDASHYIKTSNLLVDYIFKTGNITDISVNTMTVDDFLKFMVEKVYEQEQIQGPRIKSEDEGMILRWAGQSGVDIKKIEEQAKNDSTDKMLVSLSEMVGRDVVGGELITGVFSEIISKQIDSVMTKNEFLRKNKANVFTAIFFLIIFSLASIVKIITILCTWFAFSSLRGLNIIRITKTSKEAEVISI